MAEVLIELFSEEIPARMQKRAADDLKKLVTDKLTAAGLAFDRADAFVTPRRLTLVLDDVPEKQPDVSEERRGPKADAPEKAIQGFLGSTGLTLEQCEQRETPKGTFLFAVIEKTGRDAREVLSEIVIEAIRELPWPKSMRWAKNSFRWVRPLHHVLAVFDGKVLAGEMDLGDWKLPFTDTTKGHRFLAPEPFAVTGFEDYRAKLREAYVILDREERKQIISNEANQLAATAGLTLKDDPGLLDEVCGLVEWPVPLIGTIDAEFMEVPPEVLVTSMRSHQKYFALEKPDGTLADRFVVVANMAHDPKRDANIIAGNEKVLRARLSDAKFFWDQDTARTLESRIPALTDVKFYDKLGTVADKVERVAQLARDLAAFIPGCDADKAERAARLAKADLTSGMVGEFPELQGLMGRYYALNDGEDMAVANAVAEHYSPLGPGDACPSAPISVAVALADKLDTLVGFFAIGETPTGSKDPFALRRAALGVSRLILENKLTFPLERVINESLWNFVEHISPTNLEVLSDPRKAGIEIAAYGYRSRAYLDGFLFAVGRDFIRMYNCSELEFQNEEFTPEEVFDSVPLLRNAVTIARLRHQVLSGNIDESEASWKQLESWEQLKPWRDWQCSALLDFFFDRLKVQQREQGVRHDLITAVIERGGEDDLVRLLALVAALSAFLETEDGANLLAGFKRASNILRAEEKKAGSGFAPTPEVSGLVEPEELALHKALEIAREAATSCLAKENFAAAMTALAGLRAPIDAFFERVTVNADDPDLRVNRLRLLAAVRSVMGEVADFSRIEG
jgi:glycyl-tRNA synthetase beta chain